MSILIPIAIGAGLYLAFGSKSSPKPKGTSSGGGGSPSPSVGCQPSYPLDVDSVPRITLDAGPNYQVTMLQSGYQYLVARPGLPKNGIALGEAIFSSLNLPLNCWNSHLAMSQQGTSMSSPMNQIFIGVVSETLEDAAEVGLVSMEESEMMVAQLRSWWNAKFPNQDFPSF